MNNIKIHTNYISFATRSYLYVCRYHTILKKLSDKSININSRSSTILTDEFLKSFLDSCHLPYSQEIKRFEYVKNRKGKFVRPNICKLKKNGFVLFLLNNNVVKEQIKSPETLSNIKKTFFGLLEFVQKNIDDIAIENYINKSFLNIETNRLLKLKNDSTFIFTNDVFASYYSIFSPLKESLTRTFENKEFAFKTEKLFKEANRIRDYFDACDVFDGGVRILALVTKTGILNISLISNKDLISELPNKTYDPNNCNHLIEEAILKSREVQQLNNRIPKILSFINLNKFLGFADCFPIYDNPSTIAYPNLSSIEDRKISNKLSTNKGLYLKFTVDKDKLNNNDKSPMIYFDYFTLLVAFQHSYDPYTLWEYIKDSENDGINYSLYKNKICDYLKKPTEHMYFDDSLVTISVIDESVNTNMINNYLENTDSDIKKYNVSHQVRIYSFWDFIFVCNALSFGSVSLLINNIFIDYIKKKISKTVFKPFLNLKLARLSMIFAKIDANHNHTSFSSKEDSNLITDKVFHLIGLNRSEKYLNESTDINWRSGNLISSQTYQRYGIMFTLMSLFALVFSYGIVAYVDTKGETKGDYVLLFSDIFKQSPKIPVILTIIAVPFVLWCALQIVDTIIIKFFTDNVGRLDKYKKRKQKICKNK